MMGGKKMGSPALVVGQVHSPPSKVQALPCMESECHTYIESHIVEIKFILCFQQPRTPKTGPHKDDAKKSGCKTPQQVSDCDKIRSALKLTCLHVQCSVM